MSLQLLANLYLSHGSVTEVVPLHRYILASYIYNDGSFSLSSITQLVTPLNETRLQHSFKGLFQIFQSSERFSVY